MILHLPLPITLQLNGNASYSVLYRVTQAGAAQNVAGVIPPENVKIESGKATIETYFFGSYQVVSLSAPVVAKEVAVQTPPFTKTNVEIKPPLKITGYQRAESSGQRLDEPVQSNRVELHSQKQSDYRCLWF